MAATADALPRTAPLPSSFPSKMSAAAFTGDIPPSASAAPPSLLPSLVDPLRRSLRESKAAVLRWVADQKTAADTRAAEHRQKVQDHQNGLDQAAKRWRALRNTNSGIEGGASGGEEEKEGEGLPGGGNPRSTSPSSQEVELERTAQRLLRDTQELQEDVRRKEAQIDDLRRKALERRERATHAQEWRESVSASRAAAVRQLVRHLQKYRALGLHFERCEASGRQQKHREEKGNENEDALRFWFTLLDERDPSRNFAFVLRCDDDENNNNGPDAYQVLDCDPPLPRQTVDGLVRHLNESDDMAEFISGMRRAFAAACVAPQPPQRNE